MDLVIGSLGQTSPDEGEVEIVERKGLGHPDTICDALAEQFSVHLCRYYLDRFGLVLHHNVDKVLLVGGSASPVFGGGDVLAPIEIYLAGRAVTRAGDVDIPIKDIAIEHSLLWLKDNFHALNPMENVRIHCLVQPGSLDLADLYNRQKMAGVPLANDTSCGVGYAPMSRLERLVLEVERRINAPAFIDKYPSGGEDVKVMGVRHGDAIRLTVARAFISRHLANMDEYRAAKSSLAAEIKDIARNLSEVKVAVEVNTADDTSAGQVYLTVTGTSAEAGDDGEVGRGNRANGLITPYRPMTLEAAAGKNPVSHVGKLYNIVAREIAEAAVNELDDVDAAQCYLVSQIGKPITDPQLADVKIRPAPGKLATAVASQIDEIVKRHLAGIDVLTRRIIRGEVTMY